jgi:hypothetical protein
MAAAGQPAQSGGPECVNTTTVERNTMLVFQLPRTTDTDPVLTLHVAPDPSDPTSYGYDVLDADGNVLLGGFGRPAAKDSLTATQAALVLAGHLATEGARLAGDPEYPSYRSEEGRAVLAANHHRFRMLTLNDMLPPPPPGSSVAGR